MVFKASVTILISCLDDLFIDKSAMIKFPTITAFLCISSFSFVSIRFMYFGSSRLVLKIYKCYILSFDPFIICN